jgi:hypothetical protein
MEAKHTQGPWNYGVIRDVLEFQPEWEDASDDRLDADAALITAAPDLLAALEWAVDTADAEQYEAGWYADARMAIAKAKGRVK